MPSLLKELVLIITTKNKQKKSQLIWYHYFHFMDEKIKAQGV